MERCGNISLYQCSAFDNDQVLDMLSEQKNVLIVDIFLYRHYFSCAVSLIVKVRVEIAKVGLVPTFYLGWLFG